MKGRKNKKLITRIVGLMLLDLCLIWLSMFGALWFRYELRFNAIEPQYIETVLTYMPINMVCTIGIFSAFKLYTSLWRFAGPVEFRNILIAVTSSVILLDFGMLVMRLPIPKSFPFIYGFILIWMIFGSRFSYRYIRITKHNLFDAKEKKAIRTMVVGAGAAGFMLVTEMKNSKHLKRIVPCIIDDDKTKFGTYLQGIPVYGGKEKIPFYVEKFEIEEIAIAIPTISGEAKKELVEICQQTGCKVLILPGIYQLVSQEVSVSNLRSVQIEDLLGRDPVKLRMDSIMDYVCDKVILVTGGGGSIGSEICRQLAMHDPKHLIIFDIYENNAYEIGTELRAKYPNLQLSVLIGSVRDKVRVDQIFENYHPEIVFHAAAHKHVPLMEDSPYEAIKNNVHGTYVVADAADRYHAKKMVLISTDKAVRPTNVMGASKRICEMVIEIIGKRSETEYAAVRFGNVLGSNGSVIPLFRKQIEAGGPVTVTHPDIIRYFMTIPEAVNLVLQCGASAHGSELFILDMGEPVKILDLAEKMIRLSGFTPGEDIHIEFTGLRPGEKLYEELLIDEKNLTGTSNERIFVVQQTEMGDIDEISKKICQLIRHAHEGKCDIRGEIMELVPEYTIPKQNILGAEAAREEAVEAAKRLEL